MAITRIGSLTQINSSTNASSQSVSVPTDAELMVVVVSGYESVANFFTSGSLTIGGDAFTAVSAGSNSDTSFFMGAMFYKVLPATGTQTLAWDWAGSSISNGAIIRYAFYRGIDTSSPVRDSHGTQNQTGFTISKTLTAQSGDLILAWQHLFDAGTNTFSWTNATKVADATDFNGAAGSYAEGAPTGNVAITCTHTNTDGGLSTLVLKPAAAGGGSSAAPQHNLTLLGVGN